MGDNTKIPNWEKRVKEFQGKGMSRQEAERAVLEQEKRLNMILRSIPITDGKYSTGEGVAAFGASAIIGMKAGTGLGNVSLADAYSNQQGETEKNKERAREYAMKKCPEWLAAGKDLVFNEKLADWETAVRRSVEGPLYGYDIASAIKIMQMLEEGVSVEDVIKETKPEGSEAIKLIRNFSKRGPEYVRGFANLYGIELKPSVEDKLAQIEAENLEYAKKELAGNKEKRGKINTESKAVNSATGKIKEEQMEKGKKEEVVQ